MIHKATAGRMDHRPRAAPSLHLNDEASYACNHLQDFSLFLITCVRLAGLVLATSTS